MADWPPSPSMTHLLDMEKDLKLYCINPKVLYGIGPIWRYGRAQAFRHTP